MAGSVIVIGKDFAGLRQLVASILTRQFPSTELLKVLRWVFGELCAAIRGVKAGTTR